MMIRAYRMRGHLAANPDPGVGVRATRSRRARSLPVLRLRQSISEPADLPRLRVAGYGNLARTIRRSSRILRRTYWVAISACSTCTSPIPTRRPRLQQRIEGRDKEITFTREGKVAILRKLIESESFERFLAKRYPGAKRFGLDGAEATGSGAGADHRAWRRARGRRHHHRHAAPPAERAGRGDGQAYHVISTNFPAARLP